MPTYLMVDDAVKKIRRRPGSGNSQTFDELEKRWLKACLHCDFEGIKKCYAEDQTLLNKKDQFTALIHWVAKKGRVDILWWLLQNDVNINTRTGHTALHIATIHGTEQIVNKLIHEFDADIGSRDYSGRTPKQYLRGDSSISVQRALKCAPLGFVSTTTASKSPRTTHRVVPLSLGTPSISRESSFENSTTQETNSPKKEKKRGLLTSNSFKRSKKLQGDVSRSKNGGDIDTSRNNNNNNNNHITISHPHLVSSPTQHNSIIPLTSTIVNANTERKPSDNMVNGYAGFINNNKYYAKPSEECNVPKQQWSINTWV